MMKKKMLRSIWSWLTDRRAIGEFDMGGEIAGYAIIAVAMVVVTPLIALVWQHHATQQTVVAQSQQLHAMYTNFGTEAQSADGYMIPVVDMKLQSNSDHHEWSFVHTDSSRTPHFRTWFFDAVAHTLTEYEYSYPSIGGVAPRNVVQIGEPEGGIASARADYLVASALAPPMAEGTSAHDALVSLGYPDAYGGNRGLILKYSNGYQQLEQHVGTAESASGWKATTQIYVRKPVCAADPLAGTWDYSASPATQYFSDGSACGTPTPGGPGVIASPAIRPVDPTATPVPTTPPDPCNPGYPACPNPPGYDLKGFMAVDFWWSSPGYFDQTGSYFTEQYNEYALTCNLCGSPYSMPATAFSGTAPLNAMASPWRLTCYNGCGVSVQAGGYSNGGSGGEDPPTGGGWVPAMEFTTASARVVLNMASAVTTSHVTSPSNAAVSGTGYGDSPAGIQLPDGTTCPTSARYAHDYGCWDAFDDYGQSAIPIKVADAAGNAVAVTTYYNCAWTYNPGGGGSPYYYWACTSVYSELPAPGKYYVWVDQNFGAQGGPGPGSNGTPGSTGDGGSYWAPVSIVEYSGAPFVAGTPTPGPAPTATPICTPLMHSKGFC